MTDALPPQIIHGRGAIGDPPNRFDRLATCPTDDGWGSGDEEVKPLTEVMTDTSRSVINKITSPDLGYSRSVNPYRGCEHGCIYCYARPSHAYLGYSAGLDFETKIFVKPDAPDLLRGELSAQNYRPLPVLLGSNTDAYQPVERRLQITRSILRILSQSRHPAMITTKSALVARDIDILGPMAEMGLCMVNISLTTADAELARKMEPRAAAPYRRLQTIEALAKAGVPTGVMVAPMIPGLNDHEMEGLMQSAFDAGARYTHYTVLRLPYELKGLVEDWLRAHAPNKAEKVLSLIRSMRGGKLYDADFASRMTGEGPYAELTAKRFAQAVKKIGFNRAWPKLRTDLFMPPEDERQLRLAV